MEILKIQENGIIVNGNAVTDGLPTKPKDRCNFVYLSMVLFGTVSILPWSFFVTADNYWKYRFRDPSNATHPEDFKTYLQKTFSSYLIIASKFPLLAFLLINSAVNARLSPDVRVIPSLLVNIAIFSLHCGLAYQDFDDDQTLFLGLTLGSVAFVNVASAFLQGAFFGIASCLPSKYSGAVTYGQAISSVTAAFVQILTLLASSSATTSAVIYFAIAVSILVITGMVFLMVRRTEFYMFYISSQVGRSEETLSVKVPYWSLYRQIYKHIITIALVYWVTLSISPPLQVMVVQYNTVIPNKFFIPIVVFFAPNIGDFLARMAGMIFPCNTRNGWLILVLAILRFAAIPLTMYCNLRPRTHLPVAFDSDVVFAIIALLVGVSNGYVQTLALTEGPRLVEVKYQETAGAIMAFALGIGLLLGSVSSLGLTELV